MTTQLRSVTALIVTTATCLLVGVSGALVTATSVTTWYPHIQKPSWTPPRAAFGPVWTVLYLLMGVSAWIIWCKSTGARRRTALLVFAIQLVLNGAWSYLFFGLRSPGWAALEIAFLWCSIVCTMVCFARINRLAAGLLVPYLIWISYASALNFAIWSLNG
jgi:tryptophan-rich sensory protein